MKPTPTPWQTNPIGMTEYCSISAPHPDGGGQNVVDEARKVDAAVRVRAVNSFEPLVEALLQIIKSQDVYKDDWKLAFLAACDTARAALRKAEAE